jgi:phage I-like protein
LGAPEGRPAPAAGWIKELQERKGALWGRVEWTRHGAEALATREYRYLSPVFEHDADGVVIRVLRAALTNNPNLYVRAIAAQRSHNQVGVSDHVDAARNASENNPEALLADLRPELGLAATAPASEIIASVRRLVAQRQPGSDNENSNTMMRDRFVAIEHFQKTATELQVLQQERRRERAEVLVQEAMRSGKIVPAQREWALEYCIADLEGFQRFLTRQPCLSLVAMPLEGNAGRAAFAADAKPSPEAGNLTALERAVCARLGIRPQDFVTRKAMRTALHNEIPSHGATIHSP